MSESELQAIKDALKSVRECQGELEALLAGVQPDGQASAAIAEGIKNVSIAEQLLSADGWQMQTLGG